MCHIRMAGLSGGMLPDARGGWWHGVCFITDYALRIMNRGLWGTHSGDTAF